MVSSVSISNNHEKSPKRANQRDGIVFIVLTHIPKFTHSKFCCATELQPKSRVGFRHTDVFSIHTRTQGYCGLEARKHFAAALHPARVKSLLWPVLLRESAPLSLLPGNVFVNLMRPFLRNAEATVPLSWATRMMIALGAAKGLAFLHNAERPVIYRDFKTSNILLDSDYTAKLSDFGLAKAGPQGDETHVSTRVMGTYGYAAPEYVMTGHLTARSDVYSFGVVLLELLTGRKSVDKTRPSREQSLVDWARPKLNDKRKLLQIIDPRLENQYSVRAAQKACSLAYYCLSQNPKARPLMSDVVETLEPLQSASVGANANVVSLSSSSTLGATLAMPAIPDYRMQMHHGFAGNVGARAVCRSPNPNCSPGGPAACRVR
ncbi:hypothetical protein TEA_007729 [Camellia sinensis var. sinensis]|uniref:Protein kinase domain-containing protein n=1 Tax=Camellia sinensis var. sinensis TaxID=542762 RepID=A0A4S4D0D8_CAMSN|nr:hypothetical protein TEA_007729 [Camellia sinensis var. sinensis]